jgi:vesicle coat complex subunit
MGRWLLLGLLAVAVGCGKKPAGDYSVPGRLNALKSANPDERYSAARSLGRHPEKAKEAVPALIEALKDPVSMVRMGAAYGLANMGPEAQAAAPALRKALQDQDAEVRKAAAYALKQIQSKK